MPTGCAQPDPLPRACDDHLTDASPKADPEDASKLKAAKDAVIKLVAKPKKAPAATKAAAKKTTAAKKPAAKKAPVKKAIKKKSAVRA
jgi:hypothetical protein